MKPDAHHHNPDPAYLRGLLARARLSQAAAAALLGVNPRTMRSYLANDASRAPASYVVQYALEQLAAGNALP
ncbi:hypothetical protein PY254_10610 [Rhodanobacter sp. AS-Z3]|uniref:hypothetical protein n=1 Tax=Rhodanobacter sp. AS-Z3 TaxID=3031330 RepID=UPI00247A1C45|nr:hypothetical protein [Rhodanobacter sp. AS-Z3]WEN13697.1 hypothetical protein PY254_10610 [Rhodanobacter sp. AS-Z3]